MDDKKKAWSLSLAPKQIEAVEALINRNGGDDRTEFTLMALDFFDGLQAGHPELLVNLAKAYHPTLAPEIAEILAEYRAAHPEANPAKMVAYFLDELCHSMRANRNLAEPFRLISATQQAEWESTRNQYQGILVKLAQKFNLYPEGETLGAPAMVQEGPGQVSAQVKRQGSKPKKYTSKVRTVPAQSRSTTGQPKLTPHSTDQPA